MDCSCCQKNNHYQSPISLYKNNGNIKIASDYQCISYSTNNNKINYVWDIDKYKVLNNNIYLYRNNDTYKLSEIHFHDPAEHSIDNIIFDLEMHYVFKSISCSAFFVIAELYTVNSLISSLTPDNLSKNLSITEPKICNDYFLYDGGLTNPNLPIIPVSWLVLATPKNISINNYNSLKSLARVANPIQNRNSRLICYKE
jgi:carbonic anhydrase